MDPNCSYEEPPAAASGALFAGNCQGGPDYQVFSAAVNKQVCLKIPQVYPGDDVSLRGFNFFSLNSSVRLTRVDAQGRNIALPPGEPTIPLIKGVVMGDPDTPDTVVDCSVQDTIDFNFPFDIKVGINNVPVVPGFYRVEVIVPNDPKYAPTAGTAPKEFVSNAMLVELLPDPNLTYKIWTDTAYC
jgi:hypothetical protein